MGRCFVAQTVSLCSVSRPLLTSGFTFIVGGVSESRRFLSLLAGFVTLSVSVKSHRNNMFVEQVASIRLAL